MNTPSRVSQPLYFVTKYAMNKVDIDLELFDLIDSQVEDFTCTFPGLKKSETRDIISKDLGISSIGTLINKLPNGVDPRNNQDYEEAPISGSESRIFHKYGEDGVIYKVNDPINRIHGLDSKRLNTYIWSIILHNLFCEGLEYSGLCKLPDKMVLMKQNISEGAPTTLSKIEGALKGLGWAKMHTVSSLYATKLGNTIIALSDYGPNNAYLKSNGDLDMFDGTFQVIYTDVRL